MVIAHLKLVAVKQNMNYHLVAVTIICAIMIVAHAFVGMNTNALIYIMEQVFYQSGKKVVGVIKLVVIQLVVFIKS